MFSNLELWLPYLATVVTVTGGYFTLRYTKSGRIATSDAAQLWNENRALINRQKQEIADNRAERARLAATIAGFETTLAQARSELASARAEMFRLSAENIRLMERVEGLEADLRALEAENTKLRAEKARLEERVDELEGLNNHLEERIRNFMVVRLKDGDPVTAGKESSS